MAVAGMAARSATVTTGCHSCTWSGECGEGKRYGIRSALERVDPFELAKGLYSLKGCRQRLWHSTSISLEI